MSFNNNKNKEKKKPDTSLSGKPLFPEELQRDSVKVEHRGGLS